MHFRRHNDLNTKTFLARVKASLSAVKRRHVHLFERRARAYRACLSDPANDTFASASAAREGAEDPQGASQRS